MAPVIRISVEGPLASLKSTLLKKLRENKNIDTLCEPLNTWRDGRNLFALYCTNPQDFAMDFQYLVFQTQKRLLENLKEGRIAILERSGYSSLHVFVAYLYAQNYLSYAQQAGFSKLYGDLLGSHSIRHHIYLASNPDVSFQRCQERGSEDAVWSLGYHETIANQHKLLINHLILMNHQVIIIKTDIERKFTEAIFQELAAIFREGDWETISAFFAIYMAKQITDFVEIKDIQAFRLQRGIPLEKGTNHCSLMLMAIISMLVTLVIAILARVYNHL